MEAQQYLPAGRRDGLSLVGASLRRMFPAHEARAFAQLLMDIDESVWQRQLPRITLRCV